MLILSLHVYGLILIGLSEGGGRGCLGGRAEKKASRCNKSPLSLTPKDSAVPRILGSVSNSIIWRHTKVFTLELRWPRCTH